MKHLRVTPMTHIGTKTQSKCSQPQTFGRLVTFHGAQHERDLSRRVWRLQRIHCQVHIVCVRHRDAGGRLAFRTIVAAHYWA